MRDLTTKNDGITRSKERITKNGEVFTPKALVEKMMDKIPELKSIRISTTGTDSYKAELIKAFGNIDGNLAVNYSNWEEIIV